MNQGTAYSAITFRVRLMPSYLNSKSPEQGVWISVLLDTHHKLCKVVVLNEVFQKLTIAPNRSLILVRAGLPIYTQRPTLSFQSYSTASSHDSEKTRKPLGRGKSPSGHSTILFSNLQWREEAAYHDLYNKSATDMLKNPTLSFKDLSRGLG
ncbi:hypothetical protein GQ43DRAFT_477819 [Delitschia confertaspora ATCC 74209]|uniref:Uncharacterized protein n=1 Tax=Delitschia confertaspora ATCC 74209 TaxID=1513339 RepID=A0A9P4MVR3_9PLEO|nr:hypothetical protein GQ43DRAFT_477819 [Delitschia confertaspora ATCC 74209]